MPTALARILVTDDDPLALNAVSRVLTSAGYEVFTSPNGEQTLQMAAEHHPDLILLDVVLPDVQGTEVCRRIKAGASSADIFIILLSGVLTESYQQAQGMEGGADGYIARPITNRELLARVQAYLRIKAGEQKLREYSDHLEETVRERTQELHNVQEKLIRTEKLAVLGQLAGSVGHELRNPLSVINSAVYYLKISLPDVSEKIKEYFELIEQEVHYSDKIINDLLNFARVITPDLKPVSVSELIHQTLKRFPAPPNVAVTLEFPPDLPDVYVDPQHLTQVFGNLIVNACQSMPDGGTLIISAKRSTVDGQAFVDVAIKDTGSGISPENMSRLFEPLFTTKSKGIGLGLSVSKKLVEANRGRIEVTSEADKGTVFIITLPSI